MADLVFHAGHAFCICAVLVVGILVATSYVFFVVAII
jgi:hypothetical protein